MKMQISNARNQILMNPQITLHQSPFEFIHFFCVITRLGVPGLSALSNPALRAEKYTALMRGYNIGRPSRAGCYAQTRNLPKYPRFFCWIFFAESE